MDARVDRLEGALRDGTLNEVATAFRDEGVGQRELYELFDAFRARLRTAGREDDENAVMDVMDRIVGWCGPSAKLVPDSTRND